MMKMKSHLKNKVLIFGDLHIGKNKNNPVFFNTTIEYAKYLKRICNEENITELIQLGDIFDNRTEINLLALDTAHKFFDTLKEFNIDIIAGNHDCLYNDHTLVNSLSLLKEWPNIIIHDKVTERDGFVFCGWGTKLDDIPQNNVTFGHFDIVGFELTKGKISQHGFKGVDLMNKTNLCFSGHYHTPQKRKYSGKSLIYTGSAFQLNWNDSGNDNLVYILNKDTLEIEEIINDMSPRFEYIRSEKDFNKIQNNFICVSISDDKEDLSKYNILNPLDIKTVLIDQKIGVSETEKKIQDFKLINIIDEIELYTNTLTNVEDDLKSIIIKDLTELYKKYE